jgi:hypothetical protein
MPPPFGFQALQLLQDHSMADRRLAPPDPMSREVDRLLASLSSLGSRRISNNHRISRTPLLAPFLLARAVPPVPPGTSLEPTDRAWAHVVLGMASAAR